MGFRSSALAYPAGVAPGFDPTHPAMGNFVYPPFSAVARSNGFQSILDGKYGVDTGSVPISNDNVLGVTAKYSSTGTNTTLFANSNAGPLPALSAMTFAAIFKVIGTTGASQVLLTNQTGGGGTCLATFGASITYPRLVRLGIDSVDFTTITDLVGVPCFIAASTNGIFNAVGNTAWCVLRRLDTGAVFVGTFGTNTQGNQYANNGFYVGSSQGSGATRSANAFISSVMFSQNSLSLAQLLQWADAPWSFWYPNANDFLQG